MNKEEAEDIDVTDVVSDNIVDLTDNPVYMDKLSEFNKVRGSKDPNLVNMFYEELKFMGRVEEAEVFINAGDIKNALHRTPGPQRYVINQFLEHLLLTVNEDLCVVRMALISDGTIKEWLDILKKHVLPSIFKYNLLLPNSR